MSLKGYARRIFVTVEFDTSLYRFYQLGIYSGGSLSEKKVGVNRNLMSFNEFLSIFCLFLFRNWILSCRSAAQWKHI